LGVRRNFEHLYRDFGYYWKSHLHSSDLIYDQGTIRALHAATEATGDKKYARAAALTWIFSSAIW